MKHILKITDKDITGSDSLSSATPRIAVNAVLFDDDENIALSYMGSYDLHTLPGGGVEPGEDYNAAVKREVWEETGCDCEIIGELGYISENRSEHDFTQERYYFLARVIGKKGELHLTDEETAENTTVEWHSLEQAQKISSDKQHDNYQRKFIQKRDIAALTEALIWLQTHDVPGYDSFVKIKPVNKGWSSDKKYYIETDSGEHLLLRIADIAEYDRKKAEFDMMKKVAALGIPMSQPLEYGVCCGGKNSYQLLTWIDGEDAEKALPKLSESEQYALGLRAGKVLKQVQLLSTKPPSSEWSNSYSRKLDGYIKNYEECELSFEGDNYIIDYIRDSRYLLDNRPLCFSHDDFHPGNMILSGTNDLRIIDFQRFREVDPYHSMRGLMFAARISPHFATGQIDGYFDGCIPHGFWRLLTLYIAAATINALPWSIPFGQAEINFAYHHIENILHWFDNMQNPVPTWYLKEWEATKT